MQEEIESHKKEWELGRLQTLKEEADKLAEESDSDKDEMLTMSREDAYNQVKNKSDAHPSDSKNKQSRRRSKRSYYEDPDFGDRKRAETDKVSFSPKQPRRSNLTIKVLKGVKASSDSDDKSGVRRSPRSPQKQAPLLSANIENCSNPVSATPSRPTRSARRGLNLVSKEQFSNESSILTNGTPTAAKSRRVSSR